MRNWFFEVWNEPNLDAFWMGSQADYFQLYEVTVKAIKGVDEALKVGGPATAANAWIGDFLSFCKSRDLPHDFLSTYHYPTDAFGAPGDDTVMQLEKSRIGIMREDLAGVRAQAGDLPVYNTEWSTSSNPRDSLHDGSYCAAYITHTLMNMGNLVQGYSYWTFSDIFEENYFPSIPFQGDFGLTNIHGIPKPAYRAYELLHRLGNERFEVAGTHETVFSWGVRDVNRVSIVVVNLALPRHAIETRTVEMKLSGMPSAKETRLARIDDTHANARTCWEAMGKLDYPLPSQVGDMMKASELQWEDLAVDSKDCDCSFQFKIKPQSVILIELDC